MKKKLGEVTLRELAERCYEEQGCSGCPFLATNLNCAMAWTMLFMNKKGRAKDGLKKRNFLEIEVEL